MENTRIPKHALKYKPRGRRDCGRPKKRWQCVNAGTGQKTESMEEEDDDDDDDDDEIVTLARRKYDSLKMMQMHRNN